MLSGESLPYTYVLSYTFFAMALPGGHEILCKVTFGTDLVEPLLHSHTAGLAPAGNENHSIFPVSFFIVEGRKNDGKKGPDCL